MYGLRRRPNVDELITYIQKVPTRSAITLYGTHRLNAFKRDTLTALQAMEERPAKTHEEIY